MRKSRKIEARPTKWQVITDYGTRYSVRFYATKNEADVVCAGINMRGLGEQRYAVGAHDDLVVDHQKHAAITALRASSAFRTQFAKAGADAVYQS